MPRDHHAREDDGSLDLAYSGAFATFVSFECWLASSCKPPEPLAIIVLPSILLCLAAFPAVHAIARRVGRHREILGALALCAATTEGLRLETVTWGDDPTCFWCFVPWFALEAWWFAITRSEAVVQFTKKLPGRTLAAALAAWCAAQCWWRVAA